MFSNKVKVLILGGGDLASGIAHRLFSAGFRPIMTELSEPRMVRRTVSFGVAVYEGETVVEGIRAVRVDCFPEQHEDYIPILVDTGDALQKFQPHILIDARMRKKECESLIAEGRLSIGLGPGFTAKKNVDVAIETHRGLDLGRVIYDGAPLPDTGIPGVVHGRGKERVLRAPASGILKHICDIGSIVKAGESVLEVNSIRLNAPFDGVIRGMMYEGLFVFNGEKVGDIDPVSETAVNKISDKARALGGGVLEVILSKFVFELNI